MSSKIEKLKREVDRIEHKLMPYRSETMFQLEELLEYCWLTNPEEFRKSASGLQHKEIMERPPRRDREQFLEWGRGVLERGAARKAAEQRAKG